ncbi:OmpA family protein [Cellvibrio sp. PSBB006]|uniref:OmpA family protein n=1 Tax=Cellvibrio sp. PSBB006 TaxID=1987723 RepID=UPI0012F888A0|nr:OmpA family protein [Cellvibrio sp. PSBB006]
MTILQKTLRKSGVLALLFSGVVLTACQSTPEEDPGVKQVREDLISLQSDPQLAHLAQTAIQDAERAVQAAEKPQKSEAVTEHLVYIADNKVKTARALASARFEEDKLEKLGEQRKQVQLNARTREARQAEMRAERLEQELADIKQQQTDRGTIYTLGDTLFATNKAELKAGAQASFDRLARTLNESPDRKIVVEGHTDSTGAEDYNLTLSQRRADAVKTYLVAQGVDEARITAVGKGEGFPVASNDTASGRQQNRRVEVIIENP